MIKIFSKTGILEGRFDTQKDVAEYLGVSRGNVSKVINNVNKSIKGRVLIPGNEYFEHYCVENQIPYQQTFFALYDAVDGKIIAYFNGSPAVARYLGIRILEVHKLFNKNVEGKILTIKNNILMKDFDILHYVDYDE